MHRALLRRTDLDANAKLLWEWLWRFQKGADAQARRQGRPQGLVYPSVATIAKALGLSTRTIRRKFRYLQEAGLLEVTHRPPTATRRGLPETRCTVGIGNRGPLLARTGSARGM